MEAVANLKYSIKIEDGDLKENLADQILKEFVRKKYRFNPIFKVIRVDTSFYEYYQFGHIDVDVTWRFWFSRTLFTFLMGGHIGHD